MKKSPLTHSLLAVSLSLALSAPLVMAAPALAAPQSIKINSQPLHHGLIAIGLKYNIVVVAPYALTKDKTTQGINGEFTALQAVTELLKQTGLTVKRTRSGSFIIEKATKEAGKSQGNNTKIEHIEVLGEKVKRNLIDTTSSVSVFSEDVMNDMRYLSVSSAVAEVANVVVLAGQAPTIRGVSGNGSAGGFNGVSGGAKPRVSTLIDGVSEPFVADLTGDTGIWDIQQMEVFRGPQSTISGRNSMGGIVFIKTKDPTFDWSGAMRVGYRNKDNYLDTSGVISGPIMEDELAFRLSVQNVDGENYDQEILYPNNPASYDLNGLKTTQVRGKLLWSPQSIRGFSALLTVSDLDEKGNSGRRFYQLENTFDFKPVIERNIHTKNTTTSVDLDYALSQDTSIDLLLSQTDYQFGFNSYEPTPAAQQILAINEDNWTADGRFNFGLSQQFYSGYVGLTYFERTQDFRSTSAFPYSGNDKTETAAIYSEVSFNLNEKWTLITGGRIEKEKQHRDITRFNRDKSHSRSDLNRNKRIYLPKLVLQYQFNQDLTGSVSARKGYNGGGALLWTTGEYYYFDSESVMTYEAGLKANLFNGKGFLSTNFFFNQYDDYQGTGLQRKIQNIDSVESYGLEVELNYDITEDLLFRTGLGLLKSKIEDHSGNYSTINGNELSAAPSSTASLGLDYWLNESIKLGLSANYVGEFYGDFTNDPKTKAGDYVITRFNLQYKNDNWQISAYIDNVFDEKAYTMRTPPGRRLPHGSVAVEDPRNLGISMTYTY